MTRLAEHDDEVLRGYVDGAQPPAWAEAYAALARLTASGAMHPVYVGSALTGVGVGGVIDGLTRYLPATAAPADGPLHASVFKIDRDRAGHQVAVARLFSGTLRTRDHVVVHRRTRAGTLVEWPGRTTAVRAYTRGSGTADVPAVAGDIATIVGLPDIEIGDQLGSWDPTRGGRYFAPPGLEAVVVARDPADRAALFDALRALSAQDPLIDTRLDGIDEELTVSLYGEVQKEVLATRLATEFGIEAEFLATQTVYVERVSGVGESYAQVPTGNASVGLRVEPGPVGSGLGYRLAVERGWLIPSFHTAIEETLPTELRQGLYGWAVTDLVVTLTASRYSAPTPPAGYFRSLTSTVLREALQRAGTTVCAPASDLELEVPASAISVVLHELQAVGAAVHATDTRPTRVRIEATVSTERVQRVEQRLPDLTGGLGFLVSRPAGYEPVIGPPPVRRSTARPDGGAVRSGT